MTAHWVQALIKKIEGEIPGDFVGQIEINVFKGGVSNVNIKQSFKLQPEPYRKS